VAAKGLSTALRTFDMTPATMLTGVATVVGAVVAAARGREPLTTGTLSIVAATVTCGTMAADATGVISRGVCTASVTTWVVSRLPVGAVAGACAGAGVRVVFAKMCPDACEAVLGCTGPIAALVRGAGLGSAPLGSGAMALGVPRVAIVLAGAVAAVEPGSDEEDPVFEFAGELVCGPPVPTATPAGAKRVAGWDPEGAVAAEPEAAVEGVRVPPGVPAVTGSGGPSGFR
jgi:hypothetical protein